MRRPRSGEPAAAQADAEGDGAGAGSDPGRRCLGQAAPASGAQPAKRRALEHPDPGAVAEPLAQAERQPCRLHGRHAVVERAGAKAGRVAATPYLLGAQLLHRASLAELAAGRDRLVPNPILGGRRRDLQVSAPPVPGLDPVLGAEPPDLVHRVLSGLRDPGRSRPPEALAQGVHAEPHGVGKAAVPSAGPMPAAIGLQQDHLRLRLQLRELPGRPHPRVAAPDHEHVTAQLSLGGRQRGAVAGLLEPVAVRGVLHRSPYETRVGREPRTRPCGGTTRGTELRETELISAHLSVPSVAQHEPSERLHGIS